MNVATRLNGSASTRCRRISSPPPPPPRYARILRRCSIVFFFFFLASNFVCLEACDLQSGQFQRVSTAIAADFRLNATAFRPPRRFSVRCSVCAVVFVTVSGWSLGPGLFTPFRFHLLHDFPLPNSGELNYSVISHARRRIHPLNPLPWQERTRHLDYAKTHGLRLEVTAFCSGPALNNSGTEKERLRDLKKDLRNWTQPLSFHGVFIDIVLHSIDGRHRRRLAPPHQARSRRGFRAGLRKDRFSHRLQSPCAGSKRVFRDGVISGHSAFWPEDVERSGYHRLPGEYLRATPGAFPADHEKGEPSAAARVPRRGARECLQRRATGTLVPPARAVDRAHALE